MRIQVETQVTAYPVHTAFPFPAQPRIAITKYFADGGPYTVVSASGSPYSRPEVNMIAQCISAALFEVPCNNNAIGYSDASLGFNWYNTNYKALTWTVTGATSRFLYQPEVSNNPWTTCVSQDGAKAIYFGHATTDSGSPNSRYAYDPTSSGAIFTVNQYNGAALKCSGFDLNLYAQLDSSSESWSNTSGEWVSTLSYPSESAARPYCKIRWQINSNYATSQAMYLTLVRSLGGTSSLWLSTDSTDGNLIQLLDENNQQSSPSGFLGFYSWGEGPNLIRARMVGAYFMLYIGSRTIPCAWVPITKREGTNGEPYQYITGCTVTVAGCRALSINAAPLMFRTDSVAGGGGGDSIGDLPPQGLPTTLIHYATYTTKQYANAVPTTGTILNVTNDGALVYFQLTLVNSTYGTYNGTDYAMFTPFVYAASAVYNENIHFNTGGTGVSLYPASIDIQETFDPVSLDLHRSATLTFNNYEYVSKLVQSAPSAFWGEIANYTGAMAITIDTITDYYDEHDNFLGTGGIERMFTGYANLVNTTSIAPGNKSQYIMQCHDRMAAMNDQLQNQPFMDGWNSYYFAAYMFNRGAVMLGNSSNSHMAFFQYIPPTPYEDYGDPSGQTYFLPVGPGAYPVWKLAPGTTAKQNLERLGRQIGFMRYFDRQGYAHFEKYQLQSVSTPYRVFSTVDNNLLGSNPVYNSGVWNASVHRNLLDIRNRVVVVGYNARPSPGDSQVTLGVQYDPSSVIHDAPTALTPTSGNFLGFYQSLNWVDSMFGTQAWATTASQEVFTVVKQPAIDGSLVTWYQSDLPLGAYVGLNDIQTGAYDRTSNSYLEFMVVSLNHHLDMASAPTTQIGLRFVPNGSGQSAPFS